METTGIRWANVPLRSRRRATLLAHGGQHGECSHLCIHDAPYAFMLWKSPFEVLVTYSSLHFNQLGLQSPWLNEVPQEC